jgi:hypothetical protein
MAERPSVLTTRGVGRKDMHLSAKQVYRMAEFLHLSK